MKERRELWKHGASCSEAGSGSYLTTNITIVTNAIQLDIITNQLGDNISVVTEPEIRDTFPAIALAASYLSLAKNCSNDEVVVILPCDPYTKIGYIENIGRMVECVKQNVAELVLMGITPTYSSEKYGYVVPTNYSPEHNEGLFYHKVARFIEKPMKDSLSKMLLGTVVSLPSV